MYGEQAAINLTGFLWSVFAVDVSYVVLAAIQQVVSGAYPALRHHVDRASIAVITIHLLCGSIVIWGGSALWLALQAHWARTVPPWAAATLAVATLLHSATNLPLLRKIPGTRLLNVPLYVMVTVYNVCRALWLLDTLTPLAAAPRREREFLLLWCGVSTFVWVRFFLYLFVTVTRSNLENAGSYDLYYSVALPYAGIFGILLPAAALGADARWFAAFAAAVAVVAPAMLAIHKVCVSILRWRAVENSWPCAFILQSVMDATNPVDYHGQPSNCITPTQVDALQV